MCEAGKRPARSSPIPRPLSVSVIGLWSKLSIGEYGNLTSRVRQPRHSSNSGDDCAAPRDLPDIYSLLRQQSQGRAIVTIARSCSQTGIHTQVLRGRAGARPMLERNRELASTNQTCLFSASIHLLVQPFLTSRNGIRNRMSVGQLF